MNNTLHITAHCQSDIGLRRQRNEDICSVSPDHQYSLVADGIGGSLAGDVASAIFRDTVSETFCRLTPTSVKEQTELINACYFEANRRIQQHVSATPEHKGMGCTAELFTIFGNDYFLGHVGDSRTYCYSHDTKTLIQLTEDHTLVQEQLNQGIITEKQAETSSYKNVLSRAVGTEPLLNIDFKSGSLTPGMLFLLCTDGLYNMVPTKEIVTVLQYTAPLELKTELLITMANNAGGSDNITVALIEVS